MYMQTQYNFYEVDNMFTLQEMYKKLSGAYDLVRNKISELTKENQRLKEIIEEYNKNLHPFMD